MLFVPSSAAITCPTCWVPFCQPLSTPVADSDWPFSLRHRSLAGHMHMLILAPIRRFLVINTYSLLVSDCLARDCCIASIGWDV